MDAFIAAWSWLAILIIMVVEYLIGVSRLKSNSMIEMYVNILKFIFGKKE